MRKKSNRYKNSFFVQLFCGLLFALFSFSFLYFLQGDLLAKAQYVYSEGITTYSILPGALIITFILLVIQWVTRIILPFKDNYYAISYIPSCILLAIATSIDDKMLLSFSLGNFVWILPMLLCIYVLIVHILYKVCSLENSDNKSQINRHIWTNSFLLLIQFISIGAYSNTNDIFTYELKTERYISEEKYDDAAKVGEKSLRSSRRLTELRMFALANNGKLGEMLFNYPQYFGAKGLLDVSDTLPKIYRVSSSDVCNAMGVYPKEYMNTREYLEIAFSLIDSVHSDKSTNEQKLSTSIKTDEMTVSTDTVGTINAQMIRDYYYAYLLLDKDLDKFCSLLDTSIVVDLPKAYGEAVVLAYEHNIDKIALDNNIETTHVLQLQKLYSHVDTLIINQRTEYKELYNSISNKMERMNKLRRNYGNTYWWYYDFSDSVANPIY